MLPWANPIHNPNGISIRSPVFGRPYVKRFVLCYRTVVLSVCLTVCAVCNVRALWSNGWTDQDETWHAGRPRPWPQCVGWDPALPPQRGAAPQFSAHIYCGQMAAWIKIPLGIELGLGPGDCVRWGPPLLSTQKWGRAPPPNFRPCSLWPNGWMDQNSTWHGGRPQVRRLCVIWGPSPFPKRGRSSLLNFYCGQTAGCIKMPLGMEVGLSPGDFVY